MKKCIISVLMAVTCLFFVCACSSSNPQPRPEPTIIAEIKDAYYQKHKDDFVSDSCITYTADDIELDYFGEYNGAHIVYISAMCYAYTAAIEEQKIDGVKFVYPSSQKLNVYYDGDFYSLEAAFEKGYINHGNLVEISNNFANDSFFPYPYKSTMDWIKTCYYEIHKDDAEFKDCTADDVGVTLYGEYRGVYVLFIGAPVNVVYQVITEQNIDGVKIIYPNSWVMEVFRGGKFYTMQEAFDNGYLTHDNLVDIRNKHKINNPYLYE